MVNKLCFFYRFPFFCPFQKRIICNHQVSDCFAGRYFFIFPQYIYWFKVCWNHFALSSETDSPCFRRCNTFCLALPDEFLLCLRDVAKQLQNDIRNQCAGKITAFPCIQKWHIEHNNICFYFLGYNAPLFKDFFIIKLYPVEWIQALVRQKRHPRNIQKIARAMPRNWILKTAGIAGIAIYY